MIGGDLLKYNLDDKKFIIYDFENVEGLNLFYSRPHQLAWRVFQGNKQIEEYSFYLKWETPYKISSDAARVTRFNQEIIDEEGKDPREIFSLFSKFIDNPLYYNIGANTLGYDCMIYYNSLKKLNLPYNYDFLNRCYDVNAIFKSYKLGIKPDYDNFLAWQISMNSIVRKGLRSNVKFVTKEFGFEYDDTKAHEALYDTLLESHCFFEIIKKVDIK